MKLLIFKTKTNNSYIQFCGKCFKNQHSHSIVTLKHFSLGNILNTGFGYFVKIHLNSFVFYRGDKHPNCEVSSHCRQMPWSRLQHLLALLSYYEEYGLWIIFMLLSVRNSSKRNRGLNLRFFFLKQCVSWTVKEMYLYTFKKHMRLLFFIASSIDSTKF